MAARKRKDGESYEEYKVHRKREGQLLRIKLRGRTFWPAHWGTVYKVNTGGRNYYVNKEGTHMVPAR